jgi:YggT family protein
MIAVRDTLLLILAIAKWVVLIHILMSWLINFQVLNLRQPLVAQVWQALNQILEPVYSRIRRFLPAMAGLDLAPLVFIIAIFFLERLVATSLF